MTREHLSGVRDTTSSAERRYFELLRAQSAEQRLRTAALLTGAVRELGESAVRERHPEASEREVRAMLADRLYGPGTGARLFPARRR